MHQVQNTPSGGNTSAGDSLKWKTNKIFNQTENLRGKGDARKCVRKIAKYFQG